MLAARGVVGLALLGLWIYCIIDVIFTDESDVRNLPKLLWLVIVLFLPDIGSVIWLVAGRPPKASFRIGDGANRPNRPSPLGVEDRADFGVDLDGLSPIVREREERAQQHLRQEQMRRREEDLARKEREADLRRREDDLIRREQEILGEGPVPDAPPEPPSEPASEPGGPKPEG